MKVGVDGLHHHERQLLVGDALDEGALQYVGEGPVPEVVHEHGRLGSLYLGVEDEISLFGKRSQRVLHQVERSDGVLFPRVLRAGVDHRGKSQLPDAVQTLEIRVGYDVAEQAARNADETVHGVVDDEVGHGTRSVCFNTRIQKY